MRFVMVEIPDNVEADAFVAAVQNGEVLYAVPAGEIEVDGRMVNEVAWKSAEDWKVPGIWGVPTLMCDCKDSGDKSARSAKYGWFVHAKCAKPRPTATQYPYNLLEEAAHLGIKHRVYSLGFRADRLSVFGNKGLE